MNPTRSPLVSEFETEVQEKSNTAWPKTKVQASLDDQRPGIPHDQVMARTRTLIDSKSKLAQPEVIDGSTDMNAVLSPLVSEFETKEQEDSYTAWLKAKLQASLDDTRPGVPHDQVMAEMEAIILAAEERHRLQA
jgi:hypothetical protein